MKFLSDMIKISGNQYASIASDGVAGDIGGFIDTGSYALNALVSGSIYGGIPSNKIFGLAGEESTGKTFFALGIINNFLKANPKGGAVIFESEGSVTKDIMESRGLDTSRVAFLPVETVQQLKTQALKIVDNYLEKPEGERPPVIFCLDSLGMLSTSKEMADSEAGKETKDMTRTQEIKAVFRVLTLKMSKANIPFIVTNHVYQTMGMFPTKEVAGGSGLKYSATNIVALSKSKEKDNEGTVIGASIRCKNLKARLTKEGGEVRVLLSHEKGLRPFYGLIDIAIEAGVFKKLSNKIQLPDGTSVFEKRINDNPEKFFTKEVLDQIDEYCKTAFKYGNDMAVIEEIPEDEE